VTFTARSFHLGAMLRLRRRAGPNAATVNTASMSSSRREAGYAAAATPDGEGSLPGGRVTGDEASGGGGSSNSDCRQVSGSSVARRIWRKHSP
jgi:hypothetical protein